MSSGFSISVVVLPGVAFEKGTVGHSPHSCREAIKSIEGLKCPMWVLLPVLAFYVVLSSMDLLTRLQPRQSTLKGVDSTTALHTDFTNSPNINKTGSDSDHVSYYIQHV